MNITLNAIIQRKTVFSGVTALARETGLSQPYVSKLLARGYMVGDIRQKAARVRQKNERKAIKTAVQHRFVESRS